MRYPRAGRFKYRVTVQRRVTGSDSYGGVPDAWEDIPDNAVSPAAATFTRRCDMQPLNGKEFFAAKAERNSISMRVRFRYSAAVAAVVKPGNRLVDKSRSPNRIFDIEAPIDAANERKELVVMCVERA